MAGIHIPVCADEEESIPIWYVYTRLTRHAHTHARVGLNWEQAADDPQLGGKRRQLVEEAATRLSEAGMIAFDRQTNQLTITDLGRIAAKYYVRYASIVIFRQQFRPKMTEADVLGLLCMSTEVREGFACATKRCSLCRLSSSKSK